MPVRVSESGVATIVLVRHATTAATGKRLGGWTPGVHLDDEGLAQARRTSEQLARLPVTAVYSSPLERTRETAQLIAKAHGLRVRTRPGLGEVDYGTWTDKPLSQLRRRKLWRVVMTAPSRVTFPAGESIRAAQARVVDTIEELAALHRGETVVAVSHADVIKAALAHYAGMPLDAFQRLTVSPASVSVLHLGDGAAPVLSCVNDVPWQAPTTAAGGASDGRATSRRAARSRRR